MRAQARHEGALAATELSESKGVDPVILLPSEGGSMVGWRDTKPTIRYQCRLIDDVSITRPGSGPLFWKEHRSADVR